MGWVVRNACAKTPQQVYAREAIDCIAFTAKVSFKHAYGMWALQNSCKLIRFVSRWQLFVYYDHGVTGERTSKEQHDDEEDDTPSPERQKRKRKSRAEKSVEVDEKSADEPDEDKEEEVAVKQVLTHSIMLQYKFDKHYVQVKVRRVKGKKPSEEAHPPPAAPEESADDDDNDDDDAPQQQVCFSSVIDTQVVMHHQPIAASAFYYLN